jgi:PKD repeat protein
MCPLAKSFAIIILIGLLFFINRTSAQNQSAQPFELHPKEWAFVENKGQLADEKGRLLPDVLYYGHDGGVYVYCRPGKISFVFTKTEISQRSKKADFKSVLADTSKVYATRADLVLSHANPNASIQAKDQQANFENFYNAHSPVAGYTDVHSYKTIVYKDIYPHIDMLLHTGAHGLKYEFMVQPGGNAADIQMQWAGLQNMEMLEDGGIKYSLGNSEKSTFAASPEIKEGRPYTYQNGKEVSSSFSRQGDLVSFNLGAYDKDNALIIDPGLIWGTYFGGLETEYGQAIACDTLLHSFMTGITYGTTGLASSGAYQTSVSAKYQHAFVAAFSASGKRIWSTYFGGNIGEVGSGISTDLSGNVVITGLTQSDSGIATSGAYQTKLIQSIYFGGTLDAFVAKFSPVGKRLWSTYFGGNSADQASAITTDLLGNIYITGWTESDSGIATSGAYQTKLAHGQYLIDGFIAKFSPSGGRVWGTYFGGGGPIGYGKGDGRDEANAIAVDKSGNVYITGYTASDSGIASSGTYMTKSPQVGANHVFVAKFSTTGSKYWSTYFGGNKQEYGKGIGVDNSGNVIITGYTYSDSTGIATSGAYQTSLGGGYDSPYDGFLAKFTASGGLAWSTYFGGDGYDYGNALALDKKDNIYVTGSTDHSSSLATSGAYKSSNNGFADAFILRFSPSGSLTDGTYYGGPDDDYGNGISVDKYQNIYVCGYTASTTDVATSGTFQTKGGGATNHIAYNFDAFAIKFRFDHFINDAGITFINSPRGSFCPATLPLKVTLKNFGSIRLDSVKIQWSLNSKIKKTYKWTGKLKPDSSVLVTIDSFPLVKGTDTVRAWTILPNGRLDSFPNNDSSKIIDTVYALPEASAGYNDSICLGNISNIGDVKVSGSTYSWRSLPAGFSSTNANQNIKPLQTTIYILTETSLHGCTKTDSVTIKVFPLPKAGFKVSAASQCLLANSFKFTDTSTIASGKLLSWKWDFGDGSTDTSQNPSHSYLKTGFYKVTMTIASQKGCTSTISKNVSVISSPVDKFIASDSVECYLNNKFTFTDKSIVSGGNVWFWNFGDSTTATLQNTNHSYSNPGTYKVQMKVAANNGCKDSMSKIVIIHPQPVVGFKINKTSECLSGNNFVFTDASTSIDSLIKHDWSFGDGNSSSVQNTNHKYSYAGNYTVGLTLTTKNGCSASYTSKVTAYPQPVANFSIDNPTQCFAFNSFKFNDGSTYGSERKWLFGDGDSSTLTNVSHSYLSGGIYKVLLLIKSADGCTDSISQKVKVNMATIPDIFGDLTACPQAISTYKANAVDSGGVFQWSIAGGNLLSNPDSNLVIVKWTIPGLGHISASYTNIYGCKISKTQVVKVNNTTKPAISGSDTICGLGIHHYHTGGSNPGATYLWQVNGGKILSGQSTPDIKIRWDSIGNFSIKIYEVNNIGCKDSDLSKVLIVQNPKAGFTFKNACQGDTVYFQDSSKGVLSYSWNFGDHNSSTIANPMHRYPQSGSWPARQVVSNTYGCSDTLLKNVVIYPLPHADWTTRSDTGRTVYFTTIDSAERNYIWDFGDGSMAKTKSPVHYFMRNGSYTVSLSLSNVNNCFASHDSVIKVDFGCDNENITVSPDPFESDLSIRYTICSSSHVQILMYDELGKLVNKLLDVYQQPGDYSYLFSNGIAPASGEYFLRFIVNGKVTVKRVLKIR